MYQEFPKCLISGELARVVFDKDEEKAARADGFRFHDEKEEEKAVMLILTAAIKHQPPLMKTRR